MKKIMVLMGLVSFSGSIFSPSGEIGLTNYTPKGQKLFLMKQGINFPAVANFKKDSSSLCYFAAKHVSGKDHVVFKKIKSLIKDFKPECLILEGFDNGPETIKYIKDYITSSIDLKTTGEPMYAAYLAGQQNVAFVGGEPTDLEIMKQLSHKYSPDDFMFFNFLRSIPCLVREGKVFESISDYSNNYEFYWFTEQSKEFNKWYIAKMGQAPDLKKLKNSEHSAPIRNGSFLQKMSQDIDDIRNYKILDRISESMDQYSRVMIVYGASHYFQQFKLLQKQYGEPVYEDQSFCQKCSIM